jgi:hypothetical protein
MRRPGSLGRIEEEAIAVSRIALQLEGKST